MTVEEIMKLLDAGYTKADIDKLMAGDAGKGDQGGDGKGDQDGDAGKGDQGDGKADQGDGKNEPGDAYAALMESVKDLKATVEAIQKSNIDNANQSRTETKTVEDLVADFTKDM